ncbi:MAG TPA: glycosyltransferase family 39 protein [Anaerolineaceae bacterium]
MKKNSSFFLLLILAILVALVGLALVIPAFLPYGTLKYLADLLREDGNFQSLKESNALVFRLLLGSTALVLFAAAYCIGSGHLKSVRLWLGRYLNDFIAFIKALKPSRSERITLAALLLILAVAVSFRLVRIYDGMSHDESYTFVVFSSTSLLNTLINYQLPNNHVLNSLLIFFSTHLFGIQPWAVRLPAFLAGLLLIPATYALAKTVYDRYTALISALLMAILPGAILYATTARGYSLVALFTVLTLWLANFLRRSKNLFAWSLLVLFSALGFYSVPVFLFPFGMVFVWLFIENLFADPGEYGSRINFLRYWLLAGLGTAVLVLTLYTPIFIYTGADKVFANPWVTPDAWLGFIPSIPGHLLSVWYEWTSGFSPIWAYGLTLGFMIGLVFHRRLTYQRFPLQIAAFIWIAILMMVQRPIGVTKIWVFLQAPFLIWCAAGWMGLLKDLRLRFARNISIAAIVTGVAVLIAAAGAIRAVPDIPRRWAVKGPVEDTVLFVKDKLEPRDLIIVDAPYDASFWYYSRLYGLTDSRFDQRLPFDHLFVIVSHSDNQTVSSVLKDRGPEAASVDPGAARFIMNFQYLDTYLLPHR